MDENIIEKVEEKIREVRTKSLDISFNEILDMYINGELQISPDYQRLFRWDDQRQSQFIESIILEMPLPPIFFVENLDGTYDLIDGLQRISTYLKFRGQLRKIDDKDETSNSNEDETSNSNEFEKATILTGCDVLTELNGKTYETLSPAIRIKLKRNFIRAEILLKQTDRDLRYHMFKRLNTGGLKLERQEIRNCTIRILGDKFINFIKDLSNNSDYKNTISAMSEKDKNSMGGEECILRFLSFKNWMSEYNDSDMHKFFDDYLEQVTRKQISFNYESEQILFVKLFNIINNIFGNELFINNKINRFNKFLFESFTLALYPYVDKIDLNNTAQVEKLKKEINELKKNEDFSELISGSFLFKKDKVNARIAKINEILFSNLG